MGQLQKWHADFNIIQQIEYIEIRHDVYILGVFKIK